MKRFLYLMLASCFMMGLALPVSAATINFDELTLTHYDWDSFNPLVYPNVTFKGTSPVQGDKLVVVMNLLFDSYPGNILDGKILTTYSYAGDDNKSDIIATFSNTTVRYVQVAVGDLGMDLDKCYLEAYNSGNAKIGEAYVEIPDVNGYSPMGAYLSVTTADPISYVKFYSRGYYFLYYGQQHQPVYGEDPEARNSVHWDNFTYQANAVPLPGALWLFGPGLVGLAAIRKRLKK